MNLGEYPIFCLDFNKEDKMKKIFTSFIVVTMMVLCGLSPVKGLSYDESYQATKDYYARNRVRSL